MNTRHAEREKFFYIVQRIRRERNCTWREAWNQCAAADFAVNDRTLFKTYKAFEVWYVRYGKELEVSVENPENELKTEEMHICGSNSEGTLVDEMLTTSGYHVNQTDHSGKDWLDREEADYEKKLERQLERSLAPPKAGTSTLRDL